MSPSPTFSVVVCTYRRPQLIRPLCPGLSELRQAGAGRRFEHLSHPARRQCRGSRPRQRSAETLSETAKRQPRFKIL